MLPIGLNRYAVAVRWHPVLVESLHQLRCTLCPFTCKLPCESMEKAARAAHSISQRSFP